MFPVGYGDSGGFGDGYSYSYGDSGGFGDGYSYSYGDSGGYGHEEEGELPPF